MGNQGFEEHLTGVERVVLGHRKHTWSGDEIRECLESLKLYYRKKTERRAANA